MDLIALSKKSGCLVLIKPLSISKNYLIKVDVGSNLDSINSSITFYISSNSAS